MFAELEGKEQTLFELLTAIPPDWAAMEQFLREGKLTSQEITKAATYYVDECFCEARDAEIIPVERVNLVQHLTLHGGRPLPAAFAPSASPDPPAGIPGW